MWWILGIGLLLVGIVGLIVEYVTEYWDDFNYKGQHRGVYQYPLWPQDDLDTQPKEEMTWHNFPPMARI